MPTISSVIFEIASDEFWERFVKFCFSFLPAKLMHGKIKTNIISRRIVSAQRFTMKYHEAMTWQKFHFDRSISRTVNILSFLGRYFHYKIHLACALTFSKIQHYNLHCFQVDHSACVLGTFHFHMVSSGLGWNKVGP